MEGMEHLLVQVNPFPAYPVLQVHVNEPGVSAHCAFGSQGLVKHSLTSVNDEK